MAFEQHSRTNSGRLRRERGDSLVKHLKKEYSEFDNVNGNTKLSTLEKEFGVDSLNKVRQALRDQDK